MNRNKKGHRCERHLFVFLVCTKDSFGDKKLISCGKVELNVTYRESDETDLPAPLRRNMD